MAHFAKIENNIVTQVIVADQEFIDSGLLGDPSMWIQTSYNTKENIHLNGGDPLRKNFAGVGYTYDKELDAFTPPKPFNSWVLDTNKGIWNPPVKPPEDEYDYTWDELSLSWIKNNN